jgi:hypothetical protein
MAHKFPKTVKFSYEPTYDSGQWAVTDRSGAVLVSGNAPSKLEARDRAWHALEEIGSVTDE